MEYTSTRGRSDSVSFERTIFQGYAPDGGLYVPKKIPDVDWPAWRGLNYQDIVVRLLQTFGGNEDPFERLVDKALSRGFQHPGCAKIVTLDEGLKVLELFHGPTWAFKDYALKVIAELQEYYLERNGSRQIAVVATSGDTGSAAIHAVKGKSNLDILVLYPYKRISHIQEKQLLAASEKNVHVVCVDGNSDELDDVVLPLYLDKEYSSKRHIASFNSVQWARILLQMAHWIFGYFQATESDEERLTIAVPCGACGNMAAGIYAKMMGFPFDVVACSGANDSVIRCIKSGTLNRTSVRTTLATAMDIQVPYNMERILYLLSDGNSELIHGMMSTYSKTGAVQIPVDLSNKVRKEIGCHSANDEEIKNTIRWTYENYQYFLCPHSATAVSFARQHRQTTKPILCVATASAEKFPETIALAGLDPAPLTPRQRALEATTPCSTTFLSRDSMDLWTERVRSMIDSIFTQYHVQQ